MASRGFRTTGIDISSVMLSFARLNSPETDFIEGDVLTTPLGTSYQAAFCLFITVVEFTEIKKLQKLFCRVHKALKSDGLFIFDTYLDERCINSSLAAIHLFRWRVASRETREVKIEDYLFQGEGFGKRSE